MSIWPAAAPRSAARDQSIRTLAGAKTLDELAGTMIALPSGGEVRLDDLGIVTDTIADPRNFARFDGEPVVAFGILRSKGRERRHGRGRASQARIDELKAQYPDVDLKLIDTSVDFTVGNYEAAIRTLFEGAALAVVVVFLFLRDWRATVIAAITLPLSIFPAFWAMDMLGFSLNLVSFLAITLSTGILVDDAIVEIENIVRHIRMGKSPYQAALEAADEIGLAVIAISLTIVAVFAPASFMESIAGQFFKQFGITVSVQVLFSLLCARLVTPMLAAYFLKAHQHEEKPPGRLLTAYTRLVTWSVKHSVLTVIARRSAVRRFDLARRSCCRRASSRRRTPTRSLLAIELPAGSQLSDTAKRDRGDRAEAALAARDQNRVRRRRTVPAGVPEVRKAAIIINYTPKKDRKIHQRELELAIGRDLETIPDIRYWFLDENGRRAISYVVTGADAATVANVAAELANQMRRVPLVANVVSAASLDRPELRIRPRADLAARLGMSTEALSETIRVATIGDVGPALAKFDTGERLIPIRVQLEDSARADQQALEQLRVPIGGGRGSGVPLLAISDITLEQGPQSINRYDRQRQATVSADLVGDAALGDALEQIDKLPVMKSLPRGITASASGDAESLAELQQGFTEAMRNGLIMVYAVLVLLFASFLQPITILVSLPLSIGGAIIGLLVTGKQLSIPVAIGILMLMGIVTKNAIMLVDFAIEAIAHGVDRDKAIIDAGQKRARPIIMTTIAMVAGMMPSALAFGAGGEFRSPMAIAVIGGLIVSTFLSLVFVPAFFALMDDFGRLIWRLCSPFIGSADEGPPHPPPRPDVAQADAPPPALPPAAVLPEPKIT